MRIKIGDKLPKSELFYLDQNNDVKKIDILDLCKGKTIILGMPGAFTKTCSAFHLPGYINTASLTKEIRFTFCELFKFKNSILSSYKKEFWTVLISLMSIVVSINI